ncbi:nucleotide pyrophosphohydrolase [bacterium]|jgi:NTP pyrophosphatase (non-canonical NTP hydrolase)|nr:nucleotide pyrophosphohydrolase [bacterium]
MFDELAEEIHKNAVDKGFWDKTVDPIFIAKQMMMIVSEVSEAMEALRKDMDPDQISDEFADIIIRTLDLYAGIAAAGYVTKSLDYAVKQKMERNTHRPKKHGVRF